MASKRKRTVIYEWLTNKYQLIIRNEENFAAKTTISFNYAKALFLFFVVFFVLLVSSMFLGKSILAQWYDPEYGERRLKYQLNDLSLKVDSLETEVRRKDEFIKSFKTLLSGGETMEVEVDQNIDPNLHVDDLDEITDIDRKFREQFEKETYSEIPASNTAVFSLGELFFYPPVNGYEISQKYNPKEGHFGIDIVAKENEVINAIANGVVVFSGWTNEDGNVIAVQHDGNIISIYKHNSVLLKKVGNYVKTGDVIAIIGNTGEMTSGSHLHFEIWHAGKPLNPEYFISF